MQVGFWVLSVISARLIVGVTVISSIPLLRSITGRLDTHFAGHADVYLFTVMVCIPLIINCGQAWLQDQVRRTLVVHA